MYAGLLLMNCKNIDAFIIMQGLLCVPIIRAVFSSNMDLIRGYAAIFANLLSDQNSKVYKYLAKGQYPYETYIFDSTASLFTINFSAPAVSQIWDLILENPELGIMRVGLAVFKSLEKVILTKSQEETMMLVKYPCQSVSEDDIIKIISKTNVKQSTYDSIKEKTMKQVEIKPQISI